MSFFKVVVVLQKMVTNVQATGKLVEEQLVKLKGLVLASDKLIAKIADSVKSLGAVRVDVAFLMEQIVSADKEKTESKRVVSRVFEKLEQCMVRPNVVLVCCTRGGKSSRLLVTKYKNAMDAVFQHLEHNSVNHLRQELERAYFTGRLPCSVFSIFVSRVTATSILRRLEGRGDDEGSEPAEGCPDETL